MAEAQPIQPRIETFWRNVDKSSAAPCWNWTGRKTPEGYGVFRWRSRMSYSHRLSFELHMGPVPAGLQLDHLCRNRACCNPQHLEPVTPRENTLRSPVAPAAINARKTHCHRGHAFNPENTYVSPAGARTCKACRRMLAAKTQRPAIRRAARHAENLKSVIAAGGPCLHSLRHDKHCTLPRGHDGRHDCRMPLPSLYTEEPPR